MAAMNDTIYVCGGYAAGTSAPQSSCERFAVAPGSTGDGIWSLMNAALPVPVADNSMAVAAGKLYSIGGWSGCDKGALDTAKNEAVGK